MSKAAKVVHFEIPVDDIERAHKFYKDIFDWDMKYWPMPDGSNYLGARTVEVDEATHQPKEPGAINGGIMQRTAIAKAPILAMHVESIDETVKKIEAMGGKVVMPKIDMMGSGFYAYVTDLDQNTIGLWEDAPKK